MSTPPTRPADAGPFAEDVEPDPQRVQFLAGFLAGAAWRERQPATPAPTHDAILAAARAFLARPPAAAPATATPIEAPTDGS